MLTDKDPATGEYRIPHIIYADAYSSETVAYADLVLPDTTYLERWDCISLLDRPICDADGAGRCDPPAGRRSPTATCAPFQDVLIELGAGSACPACRTPTAARAIPAAIPTISSTTSASPASACWPAGAARTASKHGQGRAQSGPARAPTSRTAASGTRAAARRSATSSMANRDYLDWARSIGLDRQGRADRAAALFRDAAELPPRRAGPRRGAAARRHRERDRDLLRPAAVLVRAVRAGARSTATRLPAARDHAAADGDVPLLGLAERLAAPDPRRATPLHASATAAQRCGIADGDWVGVDQPPRPHQGAGPS